MNQIKFLGTAGARLVVAKQLRFSAGTWLQFGEVNIYLDPGPGALVRCFASRPKLDPAKLYGIIITHKHIDHANDVNIMIEGMTEGGLKKRGVLFAPEDALGEEGVVFKYVRNYLEKIELLSPGKTYKIGDISFSSPVAHHHNKVETYGLKFTLKNQTVSFIVDTRFFPELLSHYQSDVLVLYTVFDKRRDYDHLSLEDAEYIISSLKPKIAVLTHFGMSILKEKPNLVAERISQSCNVKTIAAYDGMSLNLDEIG